MAEINLGISIREDFMVVGYLENLQAEKMVKEFVDEAKKSGFQTFGKYDFSNTEAATLGNRRRRAM